jgi:hypothetical protein
MTAINKDIHPLIRARWSSRALDPEKPVPPALIDDYLRLQGGLHPVGMVSLGATWYSINAGWKHMKLHGVVSPPRTKFGLAERRCCYWQWRKQ